MREFSGARRAPIGLWVGTAMALALGGRSARAVGFDYAVTTTTPTVFATSGTSDVQFNGSSGYTLENDAFGTVLPLASVTLYVGQDIQVDHPDAFDVPYSLTVKFSPYDTSQTGSLTFQGRIKGNVSQRTANLESVPVGAGTQTVTINGTAYTVTVGPFIAPSPPVTGAAGMLAAFVTSAPTATSVAGLTLTPSPVKNGKAILGTVTLNAPAPHGGASVALTSNAAAVSVPASLIIPEGQASGAFIGSANSVGANVSVTAAWNGTSAVKSLNVLALVCGDVDGNGVLNMADAVRELRVAAGLDASPNC